MKKFTFMMALFVCAIGFSQTASLSEWAEQNPQALQQNTTVNNQTRQASDAPMYVSALGENNPVTYQEQTFILAPCATTGPGNAFENGKSCTANLLRVVAHDVVVASDMDMSLENITANMFIGGTGSGINASYVDVHIYDDNAGMPGTEIYSELGAIPTSQTVVGSNFGFDVWELVIDITPTMLAGQAGVETTYWVGLSVEATDASNVFWENSTAGLVGAGEAYDDGAGGGFIIDAALEGVYVINGDCNAIGGGGSGCTAGVYTDRAAFDTEAGALPVEDFTGGPTALTGCDDVLSSAGDTCYPVGELLDGFEITINTPGNGTVYIDPSDGFGNTIPVVGSNTFTDFTIINFPNMDVNSFGFDLYSLLAGSMVDIRIFGVGGLIDTQVVDVTTTGPFFFGYIASETIVSVELEDLTGTDVEVIGMLAFGQCTAAPSTCMYSEDFEAGMPAGWSTVINTGTCDWELGMDLPTGDDFPTQGIFFDDDACGSGADASNVTLMSDVYDTSVADTYMSLGYDVAFQEAGGGSTFTVEVYDGAAWQQVAFYDADLDPDIQTESIDVFAYANDAFQVRFTYDDGAGSWEWHAGIDNFCLDFDEAPAPTCVEFEDFEAGMPAGWSTIVNTGTCDWELGMDLPTGDDFPTQAIFFDDDACGSGADASNVTLMSDVYYTGNATFITLTYDVAFQVSGVQTFTVEVYDGAAWQQVAFYDADLDPDIQTETIDVTAYANAAFQVRWTFDDNGGEWGWHAGIDNFCLDHDAVLGVADNTIEGFSFYPNPSTNVINVSAQNNIENITIFNILGQKVIDQNIGATTSQINVSNLATGTYVMKATVNGVEATYKVIKN